MRRLTLGCLCCAVGSWHASPPPRAVRVNAAVSSLGLTNARASAAPCAERGSVITSLAAAAAPMGLEVGEIEAPRTNAVSRTVTGVAFALIATIVVSAMYPFVLSAALIGFTFDRKV